MAKVDKEMLSQRATQEILQVISQSRHDEAPVFDAILKNAQLLCSAPLAFLSLVNEARTHVLIPAQRGARQEFAEVLRGFVEPIERTELLAVRPVVEQQVIMMDDIADHELYRKRDSRRVQMVEVEGVRSVLVVPLIRDEQGIGAITLYRREVSPFSKEHVSLVQNFAAQAVIAIENVRQFREVQTRLERETATAEILRAISQSSDNEKPVFDTILKNAARLCDAPFGLLSTVNEERTHYGAVAHIGARSSFLETDAAKNSPMDGKLAVARAIENRTIVHIEDLKDDDLYRERDPIRVQTVDEEGARTLLVVPLVRDGLGIGALVLYRRKVSLFSDDQIKLVESFASQAVIAMENIRQFRQLQSRLERETATKNILEVIGQSREDDNPVFLTILENSARLCAANRAALLLVNKDRTHVEVKSFVGQQLPAEIMKQGWPIDGPHLPCQAVKTGKAVQIADVREGELYKQGDETQRVLVDEIGLRSALVVPLVQDNLTIGAISLHRLHEPDPFSQDDVWLIETFARQAVIAIENVRQFRELQARLEREAATANILEVISRSRDNEMPVYNEILKHASRLCHAPMAVFGVISEDRRHFRIVAHTGTKPDFIDTLNANPPKLDPEKYIAARAMVEMRTIAVEDLADPTLYGAEDEARVQTVTMGGIRSAFCVPLILKDKSIGGIFLYRTEVSPFTQDEVALVETFASQAVIAVENVRQFRELQERLEREEATAEILGAISRSRDDDLPVFDIILENAARLCSASNANLTLLNEGGDAVRLVASHGRSILSLVVGESEWKLNEAMMVAESLKEGKLIHIPDYAATESYQDGSNKLRVRLVDEDGVHSSLAVPLMSAEGPIGTLMLHRDEPGAFNEAEISLVVSFAAQAVIAIENVKQFKALESLNAELGDRVEEQVGEIERMGKLKRFLPAAVADTVVSQGSEKMLSSHRALLGVLFCDIRGFTAFCETAEPEETIEVLQTYHQEMGKLINQHGAGVDHRMGDGIMVLFNDPIACDDPAGDAIRLAIAMRAGMADLSKKWKRLGHRLGFGVGISLGYATVGMVGYEDRYDYTASGTAVNLAARLCDHAEDGEILLSPRASTAVEDDFSVESVGEIGLKGMREPVEIFRLQNSTS